MRGRVVLLVAIATASCLAASLLARGGGRGIPVEETVVLSAAWGSGVSNLGVAAPPEANPEGPMSFALGARGAVFVLDQRNRRIQVFTGGTRQRTLPLDRERWIDLDTAPGGGAALLDNHPPGELRFLDAAGKTVSSIPLEGRLIAWAAEALQIDLVPSGPWAGAWVVVNAGPGPHRSVRLSGPDGAPLPRISAPGLFAADGETLLDVWAEGEQTIVVTRFEKGSFSRFAQARIEAGPLHAVRGVWMRRDGTLCVVAALADGTAVCEVGIVLDRDLKEQGRFSIGRMETSHEIWRPIRADADGALYRMSVDLDRKVRVRKFIALPER